MPLDVAKYSNACCYRMLICISQTYHFFVHSMLLAVFFSPESESIWCIPSQMATKKKEREKKLYNTPFVDSVRYFSHSRSLSRSFALTLHFFFPFSLCFCGFTLS